MSECATLFRPTQNSPTLLIVANVGMRYAFPTYAELPALLIVANVGMRYAFPTYAERPRTPHCLVNPINVESRHYVYGALLLVCRRVKREAGETGARVARHSGAAPAAVSLTNLPDTPLCFFAWEGKGRGG